MTVKFEGQDRRQARLNKVLPEYGFKSLEEARELCLSKGIDVDKIVKGIQPIAFENAVWAYTLGCAIALKKGTKTAASRSKLPCTFSFFHWFKGNFPLQVWQAPQLGEARANAGNASGFL